MSKIRNGIVCGGEFLSQLLFPVIPQRLPLDEHCVTSSPVVSPQDAMCSIEEVPQVLYKKLHYCQSEWRLENGIKYSIVNSSNENSPRKHLSLKQALVILL